MSPAEISKALASLQTSDPKRRSRMKAKAHRSSHSPAAGMVEQGRRDSLGYISPLPVDILDPDALISVDVMIISQNCPSLNTSTTSEPPSKEQLQIVSIQFNSLDVIANQETIVELLSFIKRVTPNAPTVTGSKDSYRSGHY